MEFTMTTKPLTCPQPSNINPLQGNGFRFSITKLPEISFFVQRINLPGMALPSAAMDTPFAKAPIPGEKLDFDDLQISFLIDEEMINYTALYNWLVALGFPKLHRQYTEYMGQDEINRYSELARNYSDGTLEIMNNSSNTCKIVQFRDLVPIRLDSLDFNSSNNDTEYLTCNCTFAFTYYEFVPNRYE